MSYLDLYEDKEKEEAALITRQDEDKDLLYLLKYVMRDSKDKPIKDIVNVTLNRPALFAANVESALGLTSEQIIVTSEKKGFDTHYVEDFVRASFKAANESLILRGLPTLNPYLDEQNCIRGRSAARCLFRDEEGEDGRMVIPDIVGWDTRYVRFEMGEKGLDWAGYKTKRSKDKIEAEYGIVISGKAGDVLDVWDTTHNEIWINSDKITEQEHVYGFTPVVIRIVSLGSMLADEDALAHQGESLFFLIRSVIPELNRIVSILQTLNLKSVKPPVMQKRKGAGEPSEYDDIMSSGSNTAMEVDESIVRIDYGDAQQAAQMAYAMLDKAIQEGSLSSFDLGTFNQPMSAIALVEIGEGRDQIFAPRLGARGMMNQTLADMIIQQAIQIGGTIDIGTKGHKRTFQTSKLKGEFEIEFKYFVKSPRIDAARYSLAAAAGAQIPESAKRREILQREDPEGDERQLRWEEAERISPTIKINRTINSLLEDAERGDEHAELEAEILSMQMGVMIQQIMMGELDQELKPEEKDEPTQVAPMFDGARPTQEK